jgi:hypothetical protein
LLLFVLFNCGLVAIAANGFIVSGGLHGYARSVNGMSSDGKICGLGGPDGAGVANSHLFTSFAPSGNVALCLPACPTQFGYVQTSFTDAAGKVVTGSFPTYPSNVLLLIASPLKRVPIEQTFCNPFQVPHLLAQLLIWGSHGK